MDKTEFFVAEGNIANFFSRLTSPDLGYRLLMSRLLVEEENKFGEMVGRLDGLHAYIDLCKVQITRHHDLLDGGSCSESDRVVVHAILDNILKLKSLLEEAQRMPMRRSDMEGS